MGPSVVAHGDFTCGTWTLSCVMWHLVPWPGIKLRGGGGERTVLATGPPGKSPRAPPFVEVIRNCPVANGAHFRGETAILGWEQATGRKFWQSRKSSISQQHPRPAAMGCWRAASWGSWVWLPGAAGCRGSSQSLIRIRYPSSWHFSEMSILLLWSRSFVPSRLIDIPRPSLAIPPWLASVLSHIKKAVCSGHSCTGTELEVCTAAWGSVSEEGQAPSRCHRWKKKGGGSKAARQPRECGGGPLQSTAHSVWTLASPALLTIIKVQLATSHHRTLALWALGLFDAVLLSPPLFSKDQSGGAPLGSPEDALIPAPSSDCRLWRLYPRGSLEPEADSLSPREAIWGWRFVSDQSDHSAQSLNRGHITRCLVGLPPPSLFSGEMLYSFPTV